MTGALDQAAEGKTEDSEKEDDGTTDMLAEFARLRVYLEGVKGGLQRGSSRRERTKLLQIPQTLPRSTLCSCYTPSC